ncbi:MAG: RNA polymerase sigma factor, partial [Anaerolineae bacterium]
TGTRADAEDLASETFLRMLENLDKYRGEGTFRNWLLGIARNVVNDFWRSRYRSDEISLEAFGESLPGSQASSSDAQTPEGLRPFVETLLKTLPNHYRRVLELRFLEGRPVRDVAQAMGCTESNVKVRQHRALKKLVQAIATMEKAGEVPTDLLRECAYDE